MIDKQQKINDEKIEKQRFLDKIYQGEPPANPTMFILIGVLLLILVSFIELLVFNNSYE